MRALSDQEVLHVWETGVGQHPIDRALTILGAALPDVESERLVAASVGWRDGNLMDVWEANFGPRVSGVAECPGCGEVVEWWLDLDDIRSPWDGEGGPDRLTLEGYELLYRLPDSTDLAAVALGDDVVAGRAALLRRCVLEVRRDGTRVDPEALPEEAVLGLAAEMEQCDPQAETLLDFECPACEYRWQAPFDVLVFLWAEIQGRARRLLGEVHDLARVYGWSEDDILRMSPVRRRLYLEMA